MHDAASEAEQKPKMTHVEKLQAIKDKIKSDLKDHEIKKEHYHLLSSSLCKPSREPVYVPKEPPAARMKVNKRRNIVTG